MTKFGNIPEEVLEIELPDILDEEPKSLRKMIEEITDKNIVDSKFSISYTEKGPILNSFLAWTDSDVLKLTVTSHGSYVVKL